MPDNVSITEGSGTTIAADEIAGVKHQRVKISQGADGSATDVSSAAPLNVTLANTGSNATALRVDGSSVTQPVSIASAVPVTGTFWQATQPVSVSSLPLPTGAATSANQTTIIGHVDTIESTLASIDGKITAVNTGAVSLTPGTSGGWTTFHLVSAATTNATNIKASAGQLGGWYIYNSNASARKIAFHNTAGTPTAGAGVLLTVIIPGGAGANVEFTNGIPFSTGIAITTVTGLADSDSTAVGLNDLNINIFYK